jgi:hypothetical protein
VIEVESETSKPAAPAAAEKPAPEKAKAATINYVKGLRGLLKLAAVTEDEFLDFMRVTHQWDESLSSLEDVSLAAGASLQAAYDQWSTIHAEISKLKGPSK